MLRSLPYTCKGVRQTGSSSHSPAGGNLFVRRAPFYEWRSASAEAAVQARDGRLSMVPSLTVNHNESRSGKII